MIPGCERSPPNKDCFTRSWPVVTHGNGFVLATRLLLDICISLEPSSLPKYLSSTQYEPRHVAYHQCNFPREREEAILKAYRGIDMQVEVSKSVLRK